MTTRDSQVRQNFHAECEAAVNHLVNLELYASYVYLSMHLFLWGSLALEA
uniref:Ferritin n=1 Tax=Chelonoidis abingdonii TaxID=106734 RepID=A0A8C0IV18_CHEAB